MKKRNMVGSSAAALALACALAAAPVPALAGEVSGSQTFGDGQSGSIAVTYQVVAGPQTATVRTETPSGTANKPSGSLPRTGDKGLEAQAALAAGAAALLFLGCLVGRDNDDEGDADDAQRS